MCASAVNTRSNGTDCDLVRRVRVDIRSGSGMQLSSSGASIDLPWMSMTRSCQSGFLRLGLRQPLDHQACRTGIYARFDADCCSASVVISKHDKNEANDVRTFPIWSISIKICAE